MSYQYASLRLRQDEDVIFVALSLNPHNLEYVPEEFKIKYPDVELKVVRHTHEAIEYASKQLQNNKNLILELVSEDGFTLEYVPKFQNDRDVVMAAVKSCGLAVEFASEELRDDKEIALAALTYEWSVYEFLSDRLRQDVDILIKVLELQYSNIKEYVIYRNPLIEDLPINLNIIHRLLAINLPICKTQDNTYWLLRRAKTFADFSIPQSIKNDILLLLFTK